MNAIINEAGKVIGGTTHTGPRIDIAGAVTRDGSPVNVRSFRVSKSARNRAQICIEMPRAVRHSYFYTLEG